MKNRNKPICFRAIHTEKRWRKARHETMENATTEGKRSALALFRHENDAIDYSAYGEPQYVIVWHENESEGFAVKLSSKSAEELCKSTPIPAGVIQYWDEQNFAPLEEVEEYFSFETAIGEANPYSSILKQLKPTQQARVMDLVAEAGIDTSDWSNFKGGAEKAASNPKYCYEWCYEEHGKEIILLNLWYSNMEVSQSGIIQRLNLREVSNNRTGAQKRRATNMDFALQKAVRTEWPLRVIICDGDMKDLNQISNKASRAHKRSLDSEFWHISSYSNETGDCILVRGKMQPRFVDQFEGHSNDPSKQRTVNVYDRDPAVRKAVLERANGYCEQCGAKGFETSSGSIYLESHHIVPLSEGGADSPSNVIALCPNHHREAHFGVNASDMRKALKLLVEKMG